MTPEIWFLSSGLELADEARGNGIEVHELGWRGGIDAAFSKIGSDKNSRERVLFVNGYCSALLAALRSECGGVVVVEHGGPLLNPEVSGLKAAIIQRRVRGLAAKRVDAEVSVSSFMFGIQSAVPHASRMRIIRNGVELEAFTPRQWDACDARRIGSGRIRLRCAGRLLESKGFGYAIDAVGLLKNRGVRVTLEIAGTGPAAASLAEHARNRDLADDIALVGPIVDMAEFWRGADVAVVPSFPLVESFGMTALEAAASGVPVVASAAGGLAELVRHGATGMLVRPGSGQALAEAVARYVGDPGMCAAHGSAGRRMCEREYSMAKTAEQYAELARGIALPGSRPCGI